MSKVIEAAAARRSTIYRSVDFRRRVFRNIGRAPSDIAICIDALLEGGRIPTVADTAAGPALWSDAASILAAVAGRSRRPSSVLGITTRICAMESQFDIGRAGQAAAARPAPRTSFGAAIADLLSRLQACAAPGLPDSSPLVTVTWTAGGTALFGTIDLSGVGGGRRFYSDVKLPLPPGGNWDRIRVPSVGGSLFSSESMVGLAEIFGELPSSGVATGKVPS